MHLLVPTGTGDTPRVVTTPPLIYIGAAILVTMVLLLLLLVIIISISAGVLIRRLVFKTWLSECMQWKVMFSGIMFSSVLSCLNVVRVRGNPLIIPPSQ